MPDPQTTPDIDQLDDTQTALLQALYKTILDGDGETFDTLLEGLDEETATVAVAFLEQSRTFLNEWHERRTADETAENEFHGGHDTMELA